MVGIGSTMPQSIQGLTTTSSYYVMKVDDNSFKLANAGVGGTSTSDFDRGKSCQFNILLELDIKFLNILI